MSSLKKEKMSFDDCPLECYEELETPPNVGVVAFGAVDPANTHFLIMNGSMVSRTNTNSLAVGSAFVAGMAMNVIGLTCFKPRSALGTLELLRNRTPVGTISVTKASSVVSFGPISLERGNWFQIRNKTARIYCVLILVYVVPRPEPTNPLGSLLMFPFGGVNMNVHGSFFRFNGNSSSPVNTIFDDVGNVLVVGSPMIFYRAVWHRSTGPRNTHIDILRNDELIATTELHDSSGSSEILFPATHYDRIQVRYNGNMFGNPPGTCMFTLYARI